MKSAVENLDPTRVKLTVDVPAEELKPALDKAYKDIAGQVNVPGFRRGRVPARIIDQRVGRGAVIEQAVNAELDGFYQQAVAEQELRVMGRPSVDVTQIPSVTGPIEGQLTFVAEVDVRPVITLPELSGLKLSVEDASVSDEDVEEQLTELRARFSSLKGVDRPIQDGDFTVIDLTAEIDGEEIDSVSGVSYEVGSGTMLDGMDEALIGKSADETVTFTAVLAGGEHEGEEAQITLTATAVKERELPEADDEWAELASEFDTMAELLDDLRVKAEKAAAESQAIEARDALLEELRKVDFPLPAGVVEAEIAGHLEQEGKPEGDPHGEEIREDIETALRDQLLLDVLAEKFEVDVSQEDLFNFLVTSAQQYGMEPNQFIQAAAQTGQLGAFAGEIARNKALAVALRDIEVSDASGNVLDLTEFIGSEDADEAAAASDVTTAAQDAPVENAAPEPADAKAEEPVDEPAEASTQANEPADAGEGEIDAETPVEEAGKPAAKKTAAKKAPKKAPAPKPADAEVEDADVNAAAEKPAPKKAPAKKAPAKKATESEDAAEKPAAKKAPAKKAPAKKASAKKATEPEDATEKPAATKAPATEATASEPADTGEADHS